jgi:hypothetical protein
MAVTTSTWLAATSGQLPKAQQINAFLGVHASTELFAGTLQASQTTAGSTSTSTNGLYLAQQFTTGAAQTAVGYVSIPVTTTTTTGASLATTTLSLYANSGGAPTGSALVSTTITAEYANLASGGTATVSVIYPLPVTGLSVSTAYWLVVAAAGGASNSYTWYRSNQTSGASTSPTGTSWTAQTYGFKYSVYDQSAVGLLTAVREDSGARWTATTYTASSQVSTYAEYVVGQTAAGYSQSFRTLTYSNGLLTKVA